MSGFFFLSEPYWQAIAAARPELEALAESDVKIPENKPLIWHL